MTKVVRLVSSCVLVLACAGGIDRWMTDDGSARAEAGAAAADPARRSPGGGGRADGCGSYGTPARPYAPSSIWNTPIGATATYQSGSEVQTASLRHQAGVATWIGADAIGIYRVDPSDPVATWTYTRRATTADWTLSAAVANGSFRMRTPKALQFSTIDGWAIVILEDGRHYLETWLGAKTGTNSYHARYLAGNSVTGDGIAAGPGSHEGIRAAGMSLLGGLIRTRDLDTLSIDHAVAMAIATTQAGPSGAPYVWPATAADSFSASYGGSIPLGSLFAIPKNVDLNTIGIKTAEGMALAKAYQTYGGYVTDTAGPSTLQMGYVETGPTRRQIDNLHADLQAIRVRLALVTSNAAPKRGDSAGVSAPGASASATKGRSAPVGCGDVVARERLGE